MRGLIVVFVLLHLFVGCVSQETRETDGILVGGNNLSLAELSGACGLREAGGYSGVSFDCIVYEAGVVGPEGYSYTIVGSDGYQKTVNWGDMEQGFLTNESFAVFPHLPKAFWVKDVVEVMYGG